METANIIQATGVRKTYDTGKLKVDALRGIDLSIQRGEMVAVMGPSGCGKTTLLNVLSGLDDLTGGQVVIDNAPIHTMSDRKRTRLTIRARPRMLTATSGGASTATDTRPSRARLA